MNAFMLVGCVYGSPGTWKEMKNASSLRFAPWANSAAAKYAIATTHRYLHNLGKDMAQASFLEVENSSISGGESFITIDRSTSLRAKPRTAE
jgi:hypothetical protein